MSIQAQCLSRRQEIMLEMVFEFWKTGELKRVDFKYRRRNEQAIARRCGERRKLRAAFDEDFIRTRELAKSSASCLDLMVNLVCEFQNRESTDMTTFPSLFCREQAIHESLVSSILEERRNTDVIFSVR